MPDPPTTEEPTTTTPEVSVGEVGDTLSVENADGPLGDITVTKVRSAARDPDPYIGERARRGRFLIDTVSVKATGDGFDINPFDFSARERGGRPRRGAVLRRLRRGADRRGGAELTRQRALKYLASGWWTMMAEVDCSGWSWNSSESSTPMRSGRRSSNSLVCSSRSGQAG